VARKRLRDRDRLLSIKDINRLLREGRRRSRRKAARAAAEARADARDVRIAERRIAELDAGRVRAISGAEMRERLGLGPRGDKPQAPYSHRYDFALWLEDEIWSAKAPSVRGVYGVGPTAEEAKNDLVEALKAMSEHLEDVGERRKAAVCGRLVKAWKTKTT
jgi:predicted RNase H-like HicB family nuclease